MLRIALLLVPCCLLLLGSGVQAQTSYPMLMSLKPVAAQAGQTSEHEVFSRYDLLGATSVIVTGEGVTGEVVSPEVKEQDKAKPVQQMKLRFTVAPDALPGVRDFRIITPRGASTLGQLVIVRDPVLSETADNNTPDKAQEIPVPATVCGAIERNEDVDYFKFHVDAGTELTFHVRGMRLQDRIHDLQSHVDPLIALRNSSGTTIATSDNVFYADPFLAHRFEQAGEYFLEIRDVRYQGNQYWEYSIEIGDQPFVTNAFPLGVAPGTETKLHLVGALMPADPAAVLTLPPDAVRGPQRVQAPLGGALTNPVAVVVTDLPLIQEADGENNTRDKGQPVIVPSGINGRIEVPGDIDCYTFEAKKGEQVSVEVVARRQDSALDSTIRILDANDRSLVENDDLRVGKSIYADAWIETWTAPADGSYTIEIRDLHLRGGSEYVYLIQLTRPEPYFELIVDTDKTHLAPGGHGTIFARAVRKNGFTGEVQLHVEGLPEGVTAHCGRILDGKGQDGCIILQAAPDAAPSFANIVVRGTAAHPVAEGEPLALSIVGTPHQEIYMPGGGRGHYPVEMHTVTVGAPNDLLSVTLSTYELTLKPGESKRIDVKLERAEGFDKNVTLDLLYRHLAGVFADVLPPGVTIDTKNSKTLLTGKESEGHITLTAAADAPPAEKQVVPVIASIAINFVMKADYSSPPLVVTVEKAE